VVVVRWESHRTHSRNERVNGTGHIHTFAIWSECVFFQRLQSLIRWRIQSRSLRCMGERCECEFEIQFLVLIKNSLDYFPWCFLMMTIPIHVKCGKQWRIVVVPKVEILIVKLTNTSTTATEFERRWLSHALIKNVEIFCHVKNGNK
jgi:hypothetical protein